MDQNTRTIFTGSGFIGRTSDRGRMFVTAELRREQARPGQHDTEHRPVTGEYLSLSITGEWYPYRSGRVMSCGQNIDDLADTLPEGRWTLDQAHALLDAWRHWHLNDMQAGCTPIMNYRPEHGTPSSEWPTCPVRDYRWGDAWLLHRLPETIAETIRSLPWDTTKENDQ